MRAGKRLKTAAANGKPASGKLLSASTKLVQDELLPNSPKAKNLENSSNQNNDNVRLLPIRAGKVPKTAAVNGKLGSGKLLSALTKPALEIGQDVKTKKILTWKTC